MDEQGREILAYLEGEAPGGKVPLPDSVFGERHLIRAAQLLRQYHAVAATFEAPSDARWRLVAPTEHEIICHNDWSPWNALFRDGEVVALLDWDLAGPGSRLWDVANAAYCWAPLIAGAHVGFAPAESARRLRLFCDAYGLVDRSGLLTMLRRRNIYVASFIEEQARLGDPGFQRLLEWDTPRKMVEDDLGYLDANDAVLQRALA